MPSQLSPLPDTQLQYGFTSEQFELIPKSNNWYVLKLKGSGEFDGYGKPGCYAKFQPTTTGIFIEDMQSNVPHGGAALHEYILRLSCHYPQLKGQVYLDAAWHSHYFHHICGFRGYNIPAAINLLVNVETLDQLRFDLQNLMVALNGKMGVLIIKEQFKRILQLLIDNPEALQLLIKKPKQFNQPEQYNAVERASIEQLGTFEQLFQALFPTLDQQLNHELLISKGSGRLTDDLGEQFMYVPLCIINEKKKNLGIPDPDQQANDLTLTETNTLNSSQHYASLSERYAFSISQYSDPELEDMAQKVRSRLLESAPQSLQENARELRQQFKSGIEDAKHGTPVPSATTEIEATNYNKPPGK